MRLHVRSSGAGTVMRILDIDLDFFVHGVGTLRSREDGRLPSDEYSSWDAGEVFDFLEAQCGLTGPLPGVTVEYHADLFVRWREAIDEGALMPPFSVTHLDAHADLGYGDPGYRYLMSDLLFRDVHERMDPEMSPTQMWDGNFLAFAIACRWISDLTYVHNRGGGSDLLPHHMKDFDPHASTIQLKAVDAAMLRSGWGGNYDRITPAHLEPEVPLDQVRWDEYQAEAPFDIVCLARSPNFTPPETDALFDLICEKYIEEWLP